MTIILEVLKAKNKSYSQEEKEKMVSRMLPPENISANKLSRETGISISTLCIWKNKLSGDNPPKTLTAKNNKWTSEDKFQMVLETYTLTEEELSAYCRHYMIFLVLFIPEIIFTFSDNKIKRFINFVISLILLLLYFKNLNSSSTFVPYQFFWQ